MNKLLEFLKNNKDDIFKPIIVLLAICIVIPLALSLTNELTAYRIEKLAEEAEKQTMSKLIKGDRFEEAYFTGKDSDFNLHIVYSKQEEIVGYIFKTSAKGYGGEVSVMTAIGTDGKVIAVSILDATTETPGLGQNVTKEGFYSQYKDKTADISTVKNSAKDNEINAVTGATISSRAVTNAVNKAIENYSEYSNKVFSDVEVPLNEK